MRELQDKKETLEVKIWPLEEDLHILQAPLSLSHSADGVQGGGRESTPASLDNGSAENETIAIDGPLRAAGRIDPSNLFYHIPPVYSSRADGLGKVY